MPRRSQLTIADVRGMTFPELEKIEKNDNDHSDYKDFMVMHALQDKIRKDKAFFASDASEKTKRSYAEAVDANDQKLIKIIIDAWYKKHKDHFNAERAEQNRMNAQVQAIRNQQAKNNAARTAQKQAQAAFVARTNKKNLKDMNTCAELEQGLQDVYAELMLYKPVSYDDSFLGYLENLKEGTQQYLDDAKSSTLPLGGRSLAGLKAELQFAVDDALDGHMVSDRLEAEWDKNDRMVEYVLTKKWMPLVMKLLEACKKTAGGKRNTRRNRKNRRTTRKH